MEGMEYLGQHIVVPKVKVISAEQGGFPQITEPVMVMIRIADIVSAEEYTARNQIQRTVIPENGMTKVYIRSHDPEKPGTIMMVVALSPKQVYEMVGAIVP